MNAVEFMFALFAVFGSTALWFLWVSFVYKLDRLTEDKPSSSADKEETII
jgi:hypothetical protein